MLLTIITAVNSAVADNEKYGESPQAVRPESYTIPPVGELYERVQPTPDFVLDYFASFDKDIIPPDKPYKAYFPTVSELAEIKAAVEQLPPRMKGPIGSRLVGIYFIENMIGSGWTEWFKDDDGNKYYIMALNHIVLKKDASQWLTDKERTVFAVDDPSYSININIGAGMSGFYYIFYHEMGHILDYSTNITPGEPTGAQAEGFALQQRPGAMDNKTYPFIQNYWMGYRTPAKKYDFKGRSDVVFYGLFGGPKLKISQAPEIYERLEHSPFITLYGGLSYMEDFAEYFAAYMNIRVLKRPWILTVEHNGETVYEINDPLERDNIADRVGFMDSLFDKLSD